MVEEHDALDELIAEGTATNADFPALVEAGARRRQMLRALARTRRAAGLSQQAVAARMKTSQSQVAMLECGAADPKLSTLERYVTALGLRLSIQIEHEPCPERAYGEAPAPV